jgi:hypothetical protein
MYDDGILLVSTKIELRGSQARLTFQYTNNGPAVIADMKVTVDDPNSFLRFDLKPLPSTTIEGLGKANQIMMLECMKPASTGPTVTLEYVDTLLGRRCSKVAIPIIITSFNEPLALPSQDFASRWQLLTGAGQQAMEVVTLPYSITPAQINDVFVKVLRFGLVAMPDSSEVTLYGASSLKTGSLNASQQKINIGCMAKVELNVQARAVRVTLRTLHPMATEAILATVKSMFQ